MTDLTQRRLSLIAYAQSCLDAGDWHGLRDCAADLEVCEARIQEREMSPTQKAYERILWHNFNDTNKTASELEQLADIKNANYAPQFAGCQNCGGLGCHTTDCPRK